MKFFCAFLSVRLVRRPWSMALFLAAIACVPIQTRAASVTLRPVKDTTIYGGDGVNFSNGAGPVLFVGSNGLHWVLRSLIAFDFAGQIPAGATINSATLTLTANTPQTTASTIRVHRVLADWGQGSSRTGGGQGGEGGGGGTAATVGDATWNARFFNTERWTTPGGDFTPTPSASQRVTTNTGAVSFSSAGLVADVQAWVNNATNNFGWILVAETETDAATRFASREGSPAPTLQVDFTPGGTVVNVAPAITVQPGSQSIATGAPVTFIVSATGTPAPTFQWSKDNVPLPGATSATLTLPAVTSANIGSYTVVVSNTAGTITSAPATLTLLTPAPGTTARLSNLSVRAAMSSGQTLIVGFSVSGGSRSLLVRGVGPTLSTFGVSTAMADPRLELYDGAARVAENEDWGSSAALNNAFSSVGAFALVANSKDAAFLQSVDGTRSVQLKGTGPGVALVELYDTGSGNSPRLVNVSARNQVGTGDNVLIFGFFVDGTGAKNVLIRAVGPRLADLGVSGVLSDPRFDVFRAGTAAAIAGNDNWEASLAATFSAVGAFALTPGSKDAALVTSLAPGSYTVQVSGVNGATGEALVEIYEAP